VVVKVNMHDKSEHFILKIKKIMNVSK